MPDTTPPTNWQPNRLQAASLVAAPTLRVALWRGARGRCPVCGQGRVFAGWLRVAQECTFCAAPLGRAQADDAPPYFTILIAAHLLIGTQVMLERFVDLSVWTEAAIFLPLTVVFTLGLLRPVKGATVAIALRFHLLKPLPGENG